MGRNNELLSGIFEIESASIERCGNGIFTLSFFIEYDIDLIYDNKIADKSPEKYPQRKPL